MILHIDIVTINDHSVKCTVKFNGNPVDIAYFTRRFLSVIYDITKNIVKINIDRNEGYLFTHNQSSTNDEIYIIDTIDTVAPTDLADLASKINALMKV
jgi:hypothetical protein